MGSDTVKKEFDINYFLLVTLGKKRTLQEVAKKETSANALYFDLRQIEEMTIIQDINKFLPSIKFKIQDGSKTLSALKPFDKNLSRMSVVLGRNMDIDGLITFDFDIYRRTPQSNLIYDCEGLLQADRLFSSSKIRSFNGTIKSTLETIAEELGCPKGDVDISGSLNFEKNIVQPNWNNAKLLNYLKMNVQDERGNGNFYCFIKCEGQKRRFVFKTMKEFIEGEVKYNFSLSPTSLLSGDNLNRKIYPILEYKTFDNNQLIGSNGCAGRNYSYFDYTNSKYIMSHIDTTEYLSLSQYFLIDGDDAINSNVGVHTCGRNNDFTSNFSGTVQSEYYRDLDSLSKLWITTTGLENITPGDVVGCNFYGDVELKDTFDHSYRGYWIVERAIHMLGSQFLTRLLLTRSGTECSKEPSLIRATKIQLRTAV